MGRPERAREEVQEEAAPFGNTPARMQMFQQLAGLQPRQEAAPALTPRPCLSTDPLLTPSLHSSLCFPTPCSLPSSGLRGQLFLPTAASHCSVPYTLFLSPFPPCHLSSLSLSLLTVCLPAPYTLTHSLLPFLSPSLPPQLDFLVLNSSSGKNSRPGSTRVFFFGQNQGVQTRAKCAQEKRRKRKLI